MRITSAMISQFVANAHSAAKAATYDPQLRIATGRRVVNPSDDMVASERILDLDRALTELGGMERVRGSVQNDLDQADDILGDMADLVTEAHTLAIQLSNDTVTADERADALVRLDTMLETLYGHANHRTADGRYLFNGIDDQNPPYADLGAGMTFVGTNANRTVEIAPGMFEQSTTDAAGVFDASGVEGTLKAFQAALRDNPDDASLVRDRIGELADQIHHFGGARSAVGHRLVALQHAEDTTLDLELHYLTERSGLRDVDLATEITNLTMAQNSLTAVLETTKRFMQMNLSNFL